uniref:C2H2-type domain-containing protein n=1 Tax=Naja naja TaxID=35670 RepID=A0A8C6VC21_NAJNA
MQGYDLTAPVSLIPMMNYFILISPGPHRKYRGYSQNLTGGPRREECKCTLKIWDSFVCPICGEAFTHGGSLNRHLRTHGVERPYKCMACGEGFCSMSKLYRHERIHMVEKPYHCEICGKSFAVKSTLTRHQIVWRYEVDFYGRKPNIWFCCGPSLCQDPFSALLLLSQELSSHAHLPHLQKICPLLWSLAVRYRWCQYPSTCRRQTQQRMRGGQ